MSDEFLENVIKWFLFVSMVFLVGLMIAFVVNSILHEPPAARCIEVVYNGALGEFCYEVEQ